MGVEASNLSGIEADELTSTRIVERVAAEAGVSPTALPPLNESIDADAVDQLFRDGGDEPRSLTFGYYGYEVTVEGGGRVLVRTTV